MNGFFYCCLFRSHFVHFVTFNFNKDKEEKRMHALLNLNKQNKNGKNEQKYEEKPFTSWKLFIFTGYLYRNGMMAVRLDS